MRKSRIFLILAVFVFLTACNIPATPTHTPLPPTDIPIPLTPTPIPLLPPVITSVIIQLPSVAGEPVLVKVSGDVMDLCTQVEIAAIDIIGQTYNITLQSKRDPGTICAQAITPFTLDIPIEINGLEAGIYTVLVNGNGGTFELKATPAPNSASIGGFVWYDKCETTGGEAGTPLTGGPNCLQVSQYSFTGNGVVDPGETYTPDAYVELGLGACPAKGYAVAVTDNNGRYAFTGLPGGNYCVSVDPLYPQNTNIMIPGGVHFPPGGSGKGYYDITLNEGEIRTDVNFGWDWQ